ncbi:hypothetical protein [Ferrimonas sp. SCSIO 43195]|uniref:hypothetical protein n=1 Tax=Ferrimonas sp. SCSIO 43195 TaxID=2822844 RepID=UPI002075C0D0|nr:hypothetical protein [Ferrimonas sp. SCSIO 43195]USD38759.1 hypothetical protein J8Z22_06570 [Ferrimonas sp. SCSIO 43195]
MSKQAATEQQLAQLQLPLILQPSTDSVGKLNRTGVLVFLAILLVAGWFTSHVGVNWGYLSIFLFFWSLGVLPMLLNAMALRRLSGAWHITLDEQGLQWQSPNEHFDDSFFLPLEQIDCIGTELTPGAKNNLHYQKVIVLTNGHRLHLANRAAIDMELIYIGLEKLGKPFRLTHIDEVLPITNNVPSFNSAAPAPKSTQAAL